MSTQSDNKAKYKLYGSIAVLAIALAVIVWQVWPKSVAVVAAPQDAAQQWLDGYFKVVNEDSAKIGPLYMASANVTVEPSEDRSKITIRGTLPTQQAVNLVKQAVEGVTPKLPLEIDLKVGR